MPLAPSYSSIASTSTPSLTSTPSDALSLSTPPLDPFASFSSFATYEELPTYEPLQRSAPRPCTARARNLLSALDTLRLPPAPHKPSALVRHLVLFNEMVSQLEGEGVALAPVEKGWALVQSCPALALMDAWFVICDSTPEVGEEGWAALLAAYAESGSGLVTRSTVPKKGGSRSREPAATGRPSSSTKRAKSTWRSLLGF